MGYRRRRN